MTIELPRDGLDAIKQTDDIKTFILRRDIPGFLAAEQKRGFPKDYALLLTQNGKQARRKLSTVSPAFLKIGSEAKPTTFEFVGEGSWELVAEAANYAVSIFRRHAPFRTGRYIKSMTAEGAGRRLNLNNLKKATERFTDKDRLLLGPTVDYSARLEAGHFMRLYQNPKRGGILYHVAEMVKAKYGASVACRMVYSTPEGGKRNLPVLEFGPAGAFASNSVRPGKMIRRQRRAARGKR